MLANFLDLEPLAQAEIIEFGARQLGRDPHVIEKDIWVCWALEHLFTMPDALPMAFKGGTSLSKVFNLIDRFSEDIDITLDYRSFAESSAIFSPLSSNTARKKISEGLKVLVSNHLEYKVIPYIRKILDRYSTNNAYLEFQEGEKIIIHYPSVLHSHTNNNYLGKQILVEFGGRNITEPNQTYRVDPYLAKIVANLHFPCAQVVVLSPKRTFWEKATLIHVECNRQAFRENANRLSRHWYDLFKLSFHETFLETLEDLALLNDVVKHKKAFYNAPYAHYEACLEGKLRLVPGEPYLRELKIDFQKMLDAGMFYEEPSSFEDIIASLSKIEQKIYLLNMKSFA